MSIRRPNRRSLPICIYNSLLRTIGTIFSIARTLCIHNCSLVTVKLFSPTKSCVRNFINTVRYLTIAFICTRIRLLFEFRCVFCARTYLPTPYTYCLSYKGCIPCDTDTINYLRDFITYVDVRTLYKITTTTRRLVHGRIDRYTYDYVGVHTITNVNSFIMVLHDRIRYAFTRSKIIISRRYDFRFIARFVIRTAKRAIFFKFFSKILVDTACCKRAPTYLSAFIPPPSLPPLLPRSGIKPSSLDHTLAMLSRQSLHTTRNYYHS